MNISIFLLPNDRKYVSISFVEGTRFSKEDRKIEGFVVSLLSCYSTVGSAQHW